MKEKYSIYHVCEISSLIFQNKLIIRDDFCISPISL